MMKETARIAKIFSDGYNGNPWIDVTLMGTLKNISAEQAAHKISPKHNSIWEIVNHIISWRNEVFQRVQGKFTIVPADNYFAPVADTSAVAWKKTLRRLEDEQQKWIVLLAKFNEKDFSKIYENNRLSYYEQIIGIIQHDAYHLGQIVLLAKSV